MASGKFKAIASVIYPVVVTKFVKDFSGSYYILV